MPPSRPDPPDEPRLNFEDLDTARSGWSSRDGRRTFADGASSHHRDGPAGRGHGGSGPAPRWRRRLGVLVAAAGLLGLGAIWAMDVEDRRDWRRRLGLSTHAETIAAVDAANQEALAALEVYIAAQAAHDAATGAAMDAATDAGTGVATDVAAIAVPPTSMTSPPRDCELYGVEDISNGSQNRARLYIATADPRPEAALALGYDATVHAAMNHGYDYVDVFVTRRQDGLDPLEHSAGTAIAWVKFNPGGTPVIPTRMEGQVVTDTTGHPELGLLMGERREVSGAEINGAWLDLVGTGRNVCGV